jgi:hypothetical protein
VIAALSIPDLADFTAQYSKLGDKKEKREKEKEKERVSDV